MSSWWKNLKTRKRLRRNKLIPETAPYFDFKNLIRTARVVRVVDGDTIDVIFKFRKHYDTHRCRLLGVDTPELRGGTEETKKAATESKVFMEKLLQDKFITIYCKELDSFGRILVSIEFDGEDIGERLLHEGLAEVYK